MKCLLCPEEIDDKKEFPPAIGPQGQKIEDIMGRWKHSQDLDKWTHVMLTAQKGGGSLTLLSGHVCNNHPVEVGCIALAEVPKTIKPDAATKPQEISSKGKDKP